MPHFASTTPRFFLSVVQNASTTPQNASSMALLVASTPLLVPTTPLLVPSMPLLALTIITMIDAIGVLNYGMICHAIYGVNY
jgi:hypothetical protein